VLSDGHLYEKAGNGLNMYSAFFCALHLPRPLIAGDGVNTAGNCVNTAGNGVNIEGDGVNTYSALFCALHLPRPLIA
jgi:hypothetical protein